MSLRDQVDIELDAAGLLNEFDHQCIAHEAGYIDPDVEAVEAFGWDVDEPTEWDDIS